MHKVKLSQDLVAAKLLTSLSNKELWEKRGKSPKERSMVDLYRERAFKQNVTNLSDQELIKERGLLENPVVYLKNKKGDKCTASLQINQGLLSITVTDIVFQYTQSLTPSTMSATRTAQLSSRSKPTLQFIPKGRLNAQIARALKNGQKTEEFFLGHPQRP